MKKNEGIRINNWWVKLREASGIFMNDIVGFLGSKEQLCTKMKMLRWVCENNRKDLTRSN